MTGWFRVYVVNQIERFLESKCAPNCGCSCLVSPDAHCRASTGFTVRWCARGVFSKDHDFQYSPKTPQAKQLLLHRVCVRGEQWRIGGACKKVCSRGGVHGFCAGIEGAILHSIACRSKNGASHRKNCDTPPLIGNCPDTLVSRQIPMKTDDLEVNRYLERYRPWQLTEVRVWLTLT